jgi:class 3 adenylate cyclase/two-component SAPR family response regulator
MTVEERWRIELLGGLRAVHGEQVITRFRTRKTGLLLAYLAYHRHRSHPREELIELLWPEGDPAAGSQSFRKALSSLRQQLEPRGVDGQWLMVDGNGEPVPAGPSTIHHPPSTVFVADRGSVQLNPAAVATDVEEFKAALRSAARAMGGSETTEALAHAVELYRGELLPGDHDDWILQERQWLAESYFQALSQLLAHLEQQGEYERALLYAQQGVSADPLREEAHRDLMRLYVALGRPAAAQRQYQELERRLKEQLGAAPDDCTRRLAEEIERLAALRPPPLTAGRPKPDLNRPAPLSPEPAARVPPVSEPEGENRLVTVLFADMSGSLEKTAALPPEEGAALLNRLLAAMVDVVLKYEGRVDRFLGDGVLALFGVPQAHEDDPERAIRAAMEIRAAAGRLGMEITAGINTGEVYLGAVGSERHQERTVAGPVVSLASRLQGHAEPGQILVGAGTYRQTRRAFEFSALSLQIKGLDQPVTAHAVGRALARPEKSRGIEGLRAELIGRDEELATLAAALEEVRRGQGQMVSLIGEAGIGKSRLVAELKEEISGTWAAGSFVAVPCPRPSGDSPLLWLEGRCLELSTATGYSLFVDLFRDHFAWRPEEDERDRGERLAASLRGFAECGELTAERVEEMGPLLGNLLAARFGTGWDERFKNASPEQIRHQTFLAVRDFLVALAHRHPLLLVFEDLHWADSLSLDLIPLLMEAVRFAPIGLLCVYRPERDHQSARLVTVAERKCPERFTEIRLRELTPKQSTQLVESLLSIENLPEPVRALILEKSRGNPFFLEEMIRSLIDSRVIYRDGEVWRAREGIQAVAVPETVQSLILSRVDRLRPDLKQILQSASVIGRVFRTRLLAGLVGEETGLERALGELEDQGLVYQERAVPEEEYSFKHVLMQETIYQSILRRHRAGFHQQVAEAMEALYREVLPEYYEELAYHYERSAGHEKAVEYLLKAGEKTKRAYLNEAAIGYFQRALERLAGSPPGQARKEWRLAALRGLGEIYHGIGREPEAEEQFRQAIAVGQKIRLGPQELAWLYFWLGDTLFWQDRVAEMLGPAEAALALLGEDTESVETALLNWVISVGCRQLGDREREWALVRRNARFLHCLPYSQELRSPYYHVLWLCWHEDENAEATVNWLQLFEMKARQHHDWMALGDVISFRATDLFAERGDLRGSIAPLQQALEPYAKIGAKQYGGCLIFMGRIWLALGCLKEAEEYAKKGLEAAEAAGHKGRLFDALIGIGGVSLCHGRWDQAVSAFDRATQIAREVDWAWGGPRAPHALGRAHLARGERLEARMRFEEAAAAAKPDTLGFIDALSGLEEAYEDSEAFILSCQRFREERPEARSPPLIQWYLEPATPDFGFRIADFGLPKCSHEIQSGTWVRLDPFGDCAFTVHHGLEIRAANGRDLWHLNRSAPRLLHPVSAEFAVQAVCRVASEDRPAMGGLLLWRDKEYYLRLDWGTRGPHQVSLQGRSGSQVSVRGWLGQKDVIFGRGRLPAERIYLRLERRAGTVRALCSADGRSWFTVGQVEFPVEDPVEVGVHAIGQIDRLIYPGAYPEGTAIRFESFELWA